MIFKSFFNHNFALRQLGYIFRTRDVFFHDGATMRRINLTSAAQIRVALFLTAFLFIASFGFVQFAFRASTLPVAIAGVAANHAEMNRMEARVASLQNEVVLIRKSAKLHAARLEARQAFLAAVLNGEGDPTKLAALLPEKVASSSITDVFSRIDSEQAKMADAVVRAAETRYQKTTLALAKLGLSPARVSSATMTGVGGPYEPVVNSAPIIEKAAKKADPQFRALFNSWHRLDQLQSGIVAIPSARPVSTMEFTSNFGVRTDPFRGGAAMHSGVDIPGSYATPVYATADAIVGRTGWTGGYGNLVELEHGRGIQTRYGHLSSILVGPGKRVKRGELIGLMGSTGRSTGNHLHYEVRIDGRAVNPVPFLQSSDYLAAMQRRSGVVAIGGPAEPIGAK